jgi:hypothetical protein
MHLQESYTSSELRNEMSEEFCLGQKPTDAQAAASTPRYSGNTRRQGKDVQGVRTGDLKMKS